ncbi:hypothetical protein QYF36_018181 [Acer negundo]|nr:hypothetical protein QYF36_018181 [Acer negundo]
MVKVGARWFPVDSSLLLDDNEFPPYNGCQNEGDIFVEKGYGKGSRWKKYLGQREGGWIKKTKKKPLSYPSCKAGIILKDAKISNQMEKTDVSSSSPESESDRNVRMVTGECSKSRMFEKIKPIGPIVLTRSHFGPHEAIGPHGKTTCRDQIRQEAHDEQGLNLCVELNSNKERLKSVILAKENGSERRSGGDSHASKTVQPKSHSINSRRSSTRVS